jgi:hypothetical protein
MKNIDDRTAAVLYAYQPVGPSETVTQLQTLFAELAIKRGIRQIVGRWAAYETWHVGTVPPSERGPGRLARACSDALTDATDALCEPIPWLPWSISMILCDFVRHNPAYALRFTRGKI